MYKQIIQCNNVKIHKIQGLSVEIMSREFCTLPYYKNNSEMNELINIIVGLQILDNE